MPFLADLLHAPRWRGRWRVALATLVAVITWLALTPTPPPVPSLDSDKVQHILAFVVLAAGGTLSLGPGRGRTTAVVLLALAYGGLIEIVQGWVPGRSPEWADWLADGLGALLGLVAVVAARRIWPPRD